MLDGLNLIDRQLFIDLYRLGNVTFDPFWLALTKSTTWIPLYVLFLYTVWKKGGVRYFICFVLFVLLLVLFTDQTSRFFKYWVARPRPCHDASLSYTLRNIQGYVCGGRYGFFSSHATNHFGLAFFFFILSKRFLFRFSLVVWATSIAYSRIYLGAHFPADVLVGAFVGGLYGYLVSRIFLFFLKHKTISSMDR